MNVLFATTQSWNPGDDYIRLGCIVALEAAFNTRLNVSVFDRCPHLKTHSTGRDNTQSNVLCQGDTLAGYDLLCVAGTPAWGRNNDAIYTRALAIGLPIVMLGLGGEDRAHLAKNLSGPSAAALQCAKLVTTRDPVTQAFLKDRGITNHLLPCPACLAPRYLFAGQDPIPAPIPGTTVIVTSDVPEIQAEALAAWRSRPMVGTRCAGSDLSPPPTLLCHTSHERHKLVHSLTSHESQALVYDHDPLRLLYHLLKHEKVISGRLHAALPALAAGGGRQVDLLPGCSPRITQAFQTAQKWFLEDTATDQALIYHYTRHLRQALPVNLSSPASPTQPPDPDFKTTD